MIHSIMVNKKKSTPKLNSMTQGTDFLGLEINDTFLRAKPIRLLLCIGTAPMPVLSKYIDTDNSYVSVLMKKFRSMGLIYRVDKVDNNFMYNLTDKGVKVKEHLILLLTASNENKC